MKVQVISDVHTEFHKDGGELWAKNQDATNVDTLVIAGDLGLFKMDYKYIDIVLKTLCEKYRNVIMVLGNHEYYQSNLDDVKKRVIMLKNKFNNLHILENETVTIDRQRFIGCTLWFKKDMKNTYDNNLNDFNVISGFRKWNKEKNSESMEYLRNNVKNDDIVITHHIPSNKCINSKYKGNYMNVFFVCEMDDVILNNKPKMWIFGHTHEGCRFKYENTEMVCNPTGYPHENVNYERKMVIDI